MTSPSWAAPKIGDACDGSANQITTKSSDIQAEGVIQCIPDSNGSYFWQAMGAVARYDATTKCTVAGILRWNGSSIQYCNGTTWIGFKSGFPPNETLSTSIFGGTPSKWIASCTVSTDKNGVSSLSFSSASMGNYPNQRGHIFTVEGTSSLPGTTYITCAVDEAGLTISSGHYASGFGAVSSLTPWD